MAFDTTLARRIRAILAGAGNIEEKKMFGGLAFMIDNQMTLTVGKDRIMVRIHPARRGELLRRKGCRLVIMNGREYRNYLYVDARVLIRKQDLVSWVRSALDSRQPLAQPAK